MNENVENLILTQLRDLRAGQDRLDAKIDSLKTMVGGHGVMLSELAGYVGGMEERLEALETQNPK